MTWRLLPIALALLLAGCTGAAPPPPTPTATHVPEGPLVWDLMDCQAMSWEVIVPASRLAARMPEGFTPAPTQGAGVPSGIEQATTLVFEAVECATGYDSELQVARSVPYARLATPVLPPAGKADGRPGTQHAVLWASVVSDDDWRPRLAAAGLPVHDGGTLVGPNAQGYSGVLAIDGVGTFSITGRPDSGQPRQAIALRDFAPVPDGAALIGTRTDVTTGSGIGVWDVTADSWVAEVIGTTQGVAAFQLSTWSMPHTAVTRPGVNGNGGPADRAATFM